MPPDPSEPERVAQAAADLGLKYVVVTSVTRDDLPDQGSGHFVDTVSAIRDLLPQAGIEVLTPDFQGARDAIARVVRSGPDVYNHNLETVKRLQPVWRPQASYDCSLSVLRTVKEIAPERVTKSGLMLGLGETGDEVMTAALDLRSAGCDILTLGQYLQPSPECCEAKDYVRPEIFSGWKHRLERMGFHQVIAGPYVRSSYHAFESFSGIQDRNKETKERVCYDGSNA